MSTSAAFLPEDALSVAAPAAHHSRAGHRHPHHRQRARHPRPSGHVESRRALLGRLFRTPVANAQLEKICRGEPGRGRIPAGPALTPFFDEQIDAMRRTLREAGVAVAR
jgi:hypothetical protein